MSRCDRGCSELQEAVTLYCTFPPFSQYCSWESNGKATETSRHLKGQFRCKDVGNCKSPLNGSSDDVELIKELILSQRPLS